MSDDAKIIPTDAETLDLVHRYAVSAQELIAIQRRIGQDYDLTAEWRAAERTSNAAWIQAREAGHTVAELTQASRALDVNS